MVNMRRLTISHNAYVLLKIHPHKLQLHQHFFPSISGLSKVSNSSTCLTHSLAISSQWVDEAIVSRLESNLQQLCSGTSNLVRQGKQVHAQCVLHGLLDNGLLGPKILGMYVLCDSFRDAVKMFYQVPLHYTMPWNWMIRGLNKLGRFDLALLFYFKMWTCGVSPDKYTFPSVVKACGGLNNVALGKLIQDDVLDMRFDLDMYMGSALVKLYAENGHLQDARLLFDRMSKKDCVLWNVMLSSFAKYGESGSTLKAFNEMRNSGIIPNAVTFACVLSVCSADAMIRFGSLIHGLAVTSGLQFDPHVANTLVSMYSKCRWLGDARKLFDRMLQTDLVKWNCMMAGLVQHGFMEDASNLFKEMISAGVKPDGRTFATFLPSVTDSMSFSLGKEIHGYIIRHGISLDVFLKSALIDIYCKCRNVEMAYKIYSQSSSIDLVMSTAMISGYVLNGKANSALEVFRWLLQEKMSPNSLTMASVLPACASLAALKLGKELHGKILKDGLVLEGNVHLESAVMDMYAKCGRLDLAHQIFRRMHVKDAVCWNSIITSCTQNSKPAEAIELFRKMGKEEGLTYNRVTISAALSACTDLSSLQYGKQIHTVLVKSAVDYDVFAQSALIDMYAKCGNLKLARCTFDNMENKNEVSWNSVIAAYANHGCLDETLTLFHGMLETGIHPDHVTFLAVISACAHAGQVDDGIRYFHYMTEEFKISAKMEHYASLVDMFGRAGQLNEAYGVIKSMPFQPDAGVWGTLLGASRVHGNVELAKVASSYLLELDPNNSGYYVLLANVHADASQWKSMRKIRTMMKERGVQKVPGYSWVDVDKSTHMFVAGDGSHPESAEIYSLLENLLIPELRREGYVPHPYIPVHPQYTDRLSLVTRRTSLLCHYLQLLLSIFIRFCDWLSSPCFSFFIHSPGSFLSPSQCFPSFQWPRKLSIVAVARSAITLPSNYKGDKSPLSNSLEPASMVYKPETAGARKKSLKKYRLMKMCSGIMSFWQLSGRRQLSLVRLFLGGGWIFTKRFFCAFIYCVVQSYKVDKAEQNASEKLAMTVAVVKAYDNATEDIKEIYTADLKLQNIIDSPSLDAACRKIDDFGTKKNISQLDSALVLLPSEAWWDAKETNMTKNEV
ncbi:unnamed protein product [Linum tenue]|uniref:Pentatricopeptide repeat-containing protein n=1 Tax=Linum tenue TaxID=586396 RepID=A0AAV0QVF4_9ROSI|nr:unnamed protein product [Linum tenue]